MAGQQKTGKLTLRLKLLYGSGQGVNSAIDAGINTFLLYYLTTVQGMSGSAAGLIFFLSLTIDALLDPSIGRATDRWRSRWGRRLPFMAFALVPMVVSAVAIFAVPSALSGVTLFAYVLLFNIGLRVGLSLFALPHSALTAELTDDYAERSNVTAFRAVFIFVGTLACIVPATSLIFVNNGLDSVNAYPTFGALLAGLILLFGGTSILGTARVAMTLPQGESDSPSGASLFGELAQLAKNPAFVSLLLTAIIVLVAQGVVVSLNLHSYRYFWGLSTEEMQLPITLLPIGMAIGIPVAGLLLRYIEKRDGVLGAIAVLTTYSAAAPFFVWSGIVDPGSAAALTLAIGNSVLFGLGGAVCFICFYSMMADAVDEHDLLFGVRREALYAAGLMLGAKAATGLGGLISGTGLQLIGFSAEAKSGAASLEPSVINGIGVLWGPVPALLMLSSLPLMLRYHIDRKHHAEVLERLGERAPNLS